MSMIDRPNSEAIFRAVNVYVDCMRPFILRCLSQTYGASQVQEAIVASLNERQVENFAIDLQKNDGNVTVTLDVNHFRPIIETHWDAIFAEQFGYDSTIPGTVGWITGARNDADHPGTVDISDDDTRAHLNNALKILRRINASEGVQAVEEISRYLDNPNSGVQVGMPQIQYGVANSICANIACQNINQFQHPVSEMGRAVVQCLKCAKEYTVSTFTIVSSEGRYDPNRGINGYVWRIRFVNGEETVVEYYHSLNVTIERNDTVTASLDQYENLVYLVNENVRLWWYFTYGAMAQGSWWRGAGRVQYTGCYSVLSRFVANSFYSPASGSFDRFVSKILARIVMAFTGHPEIPLAGRLN